MKRNYVFKVLLLVAKFCHCKKLSKWPQDEFNGFGNLNKSILVVVEFFISHYPPQW